MIVKLCLKKINVIYYLIVQKYNILNRQENNAAGKSRGNDRTTEGVDACAEPVVLSCFDEDKIEATFARRGKNSFRRFVAFDAVCSSPI